MGQMERRGAGTKQARPAPRAPCLGEFYANVSDKHHAYRRLSTFYSGIVCIKCGEYWPGDKAGERAARLHCKSLNSDPNPIVANAAAGGSKKAQKKGKKGAV